jgi:gamma-glutamyltranspeptidase / glutathione hydrolase
MHRSLTALVTTLAIGMLAPTIAGASEGSKYRPPVRAKGGMVATESPAAGLIGKQILDAGGNAMDAMVATVYATAVARVESCGIGGGGYMLWRGADGTAAALDFREIAPAADDAHLYDDPGLHNAFTGHLTIGVPGVVAGIEAARERFGTMSRPDLIAPAAKLAAEGWEVDNDFQTESVPYGPSKLRLFRTSADQFLIGGVLPYPAGSTLVQPTLAADLSLIAKDGPDAFYRGRIADAIAADMADPELPGDPGPMTKADLAAYKPIWRDPLVTTYRGHTVYAVPPSTSGGVLAIEMLNVLEGFDLKAAGQDSADELHLIAEAQKLAWADRAKYLADPDKVKVPTAVLTSKAYADKRRKEISPTESRSYSAGDVGGGVPDRQPGAEGNPAGSTTHISIIDSAGNAASLTCTVESPFGSGVVAPGTGILLNNQLTDFSGAGTANEPGPGKRPRSSITPLIVTDAGGTRPILVVGGAGCATIPMGSILATINVVDFGQDVDHAVDQERLDDTAEPLSLENVRVPADVQVELARRGHTLQPEGEYGLTPRTQVAGIEADGSRVGASDSRTEFATFGSDRIALPVRKPGVHPRLVLAGRLPRLARRPGSGRPRSVRFRVRAIDGTIGTVQATLRRQLAKGRSVKVATTRTPVAVGRRPRTLVLRLVAGQRLSRGRYVLAVTGAAREQLLVRRFRLR